MEQVHLPYEGWWGILPEMQYRCSGRYLITCMRDSGRGKAGKQYSAYGIAVIMSLEFLLCLEDYFEIGTAFHGGHDTFPRNSGRRCFHATGSGFPAYTQIHQMIPAKVHIYAQGKGGKKDQERQCNCQELLKYAFHLPIKLRKNPYPPGKSATQEHSGKER